MHKIIARNFRWLLILQVLALVLASAPAAAAPIAQPVTPPAVSEHQAASSYEYSACRRASDKNALREEIARLIRDTLENPEAPLDVDAMVAKAWEESLIADTIDREVDNIVEDLLENEPWHLRAASAWMPPVAEAYAKRVAEELFSSKSFKTTVESLSRLAATALSTKMTAEFNHAASIGLRCLQEFAQKKYSSALFAKSLEETVSSLVNDNLPLESISTIAQPGPNIPGLEGVAVILATYLMTRLAREIGEKNSRTHRRENRRTNLGQRCVLTRSGCRMDNRDRNACL
jgi:hypothetical protein